MSEERINELALGLFESMPTFIRHNHEWQTLLLEKFQKTIRLAIKESSQEKDEVIRKLVDSVDDPEKLLRALNTLG